VSHGPAGTVTGFELPLRSFHGNLRGSGITAIPHQERGLPGRNQALGSVGPEGGTRRVESEGAEAAAMEEAVLTCDRSIACSTLGQVAPFLSHLPAADAATGSIRPGQ
jgi:hypothetical protein